MFRLLGGCGVCVGGGGGGGGGGSHPHPHPHTATPPLLPRTSGRACSFALICLKLCIGLIITIIKCEFISGT